MATHINNSVRRRTTRNLAIFIAATLGIGWLGRVLDLVTGRPSTEGLGYFSGSSFLPRSRCCFAPFGGDGWRDAGITPNLRGNARWYALALLVYPVLTAVVVAVGSLLGLITTAGPSWAAVAAILQTSALGLAPRRRSCREGARDPAAAAAYQDDRLQRARRRPNTAREWAPRRSRRLLDRVGRDRWRVCRNY